MRSSVILISRKTQDRNQQPCSQLSRPKQVKRKEGELQVPVLPREAKLQRSMEKWQTLVAFLQEGTMKNQEPGSDSNLYRYDGLLPFTDAKGDR